MKGVVYLFCVIVLLAVGCTGKPDDSRLLEIAEKVSDSPEEMLARLDSMNTGSMKESDRYFHALMRIKAQDKAYVKHKSDSLILRVINYYSRNKNSGYYPEALYYGGRVYSDIGDAPTALRYFKDALDALPEDGDKRLKATVLVQAGWLLNSVHLYREAARYMNEAGTLVSESLDSMHIMMSSQLLGAIYMHSKDFERADSCIREALYIAEKISPTDTVQQYMYLAAIHMEQGRMDSALYYIRRITPPVGTKYRDMINDYAANIYFLSDHPDSAYAYAQRLISTGEVNRQRNGYHIILNPKLRSITPSDSLLSYTLAYSEVLDRYLALHDGGQVAIQSSLYNYHIHERERLKAEEAKRWYMYVAIALIILVLMLSVAILYVRNRNIRVLLQYHNALDDIECLKKTILAKKEISVDSDMQIQDNCDVNGLLITSSPPDEKLCDDEKETLLSDATREKLREKLKVELLALQKAGEAKKEVDERIRSSSAYGRLQEYLSADRRIPDSDSLWIGLEEEVLNVSSNFKSGLYLLSGDKLKEDAYHMGATHQVRNDTYRIDCPDGKDQRSRVFASRLYMRDDIRQKVGSQGDG